MDQLSHIDNEGRVRMVDASDKPATARQAVASARVFMSKETIGAVRDHRTPKGDPLEVARLAGIMAAKRTSELIPLCHPLPLDSVSIEFGFPDDSTLGIEATARVTARTGVEMEALTAVSVAALTVYDMCKAIDRGITIAAIQLEEK